MKLSKKTILGLVGLVCFVVIASGCTSSDNNSTSNASSSNDVTVVINYSGNWAADVSGTLGYRALGSTGNQTTNLGSVSGPLTVSARKTEGGNGVLTVSIMKNGKTLSTASTSAPYGGATAYATV